MVIITVIITIIITDKRQAWLALKTGSRISNSGFQTWLYMEITCPEFPHPRPIRSEDPRWYSLKLFA